MGMRKINQAIDYFSSLAFVSLSDWLIEIKGWHPKTINEIRANENILHFDSIDLTNEEIAEINRQYYNIFCHLVTINTTEELNSREKSEVKRYFGLDLRVIKHHD